MYSSTVGRAGSCNESIMNRHRGAKSSSRFRLTKLLYLGVYAIQGGALSRRINIFTEGRYLVQITDAEKKQLGDRYCVEVFFLENSCWYEVVYYVQLQSVKHHRSSNIPDFGTRVFLHFFYNVEKITNVDNATDNKTHPNHK